MRLTVLGVVFWLFTAPAWAASPWEVRTVKDPISDAVRTIATTRGPGGSLSLKCDGVGSSVYVQLTSAEFLGSADYTTPDVVHRFDSQKPQGSAWKYDGRVAVLLNMREVEQFAAQLATAKTVAIRATTFEGHIVDATFGVAPADPIVRKVYSACGFDPPVLSAR